MSTMREQFETWQSKQGRALRLAKEDSGKYCSSDVQSDWDVWQAATEAAKAEPTEFKGWYCAHCQRGVDASEVTFHEQHTECGRVITDDCPPAAKAAGTAGEQTKHAAESIEKLVTPIVTGIREFYLGMVSRSLRNDRADVLDIARSSDSTYAAYLGVQGEFAKLFEAARQPAPVLSQARIHDITIQEACKIGGGLVDEIPADDLTALGRAIAERILAATKSQPAPVALSDQKIWDLLVDEVGVEHISGTGEYAKYGAVLWTPAQAAEVFRAILTATNRSQP